MKRALITGITGQDGSYLAELLLEKGYEVHGLVRRSSGPSTGRIDHIIDRLTLHYGDICDGLSIRQALDRSTPDEVYNLAAQSHVMVSFEHPIYAADATGIGALRVLEAVRESGAHAKVYQACSSEMFGASPPPQNENTPFMPRSPYACAKVYGYMQARMYRDAYNMFVCNGILFNHESPRRGENFVTRKITRAIARIKCGLQKQLRLGNIASYRDWGFAGDYVRAMWMMMQDPIPGDYVIATEESHTVGEFLKIACECAGIHPLDHVVQDGRLWRPAEVHALRGDASKARIELGWAPTVGFRDLVKMMFDHDWNLAVKESRCAAR